MTLKNPAPGFKNHPSHSVEINAFEGDVEIRINGEIVATSKRAMSLKENGYSDVYYIPISDLPEKMLDCSEHSTYCPFKGDASYYHLIHDGKTYENAVWSYPSPFDEAMAIKDHIAIYPNVAKIEPAQE